ncbi:Rpn family recombination-promoting nuclease/putative transposase [Fibrobacter sp. UBA2449]|uniref:Rpn family recombination-promoting nuclease/putative transposase n=1 Tax=Fibrobacter sp. UBA2449 TaxID=1946529 RepID=UPI0025BAFEE4|nr:Rpn family recombination-promoting nuclease/putative transposase [Fibrobacter sp. UBA2449]
MTKEQYAEMLHDISETHKTGGDTAACIAKYRKRYKFAYIYNDTIFKLLFGTPENMEFTASFLNAILKLDGGDCIDKLTFVNTAVEGALSKKVISDVVVENESLERIVLEVQHKEDDTYSDRLVYYVAKHTVASKAHGESYWLRNLNLISLQMFNGFPESRNYRHSIRLKNQENDEFFKKQTITLVEIPKFLKGDYSSDSSMLAQWLRVINGLNEENPVPVPEGSLFARLQEKAKLSIFTEEFLVSEAMNMSDRLYEMYVEKKHARAEGLAEGRAEGLAEGRAEGRAVGRTEGIDILESLGVSSDLIEKARKIAAEKAKESPSKP